MRPSHSDLLVGSIAVDPTLRQSISEEPLRIVLRRQLEGAALPEHKTIYLSLGVGGTGGHVVSAVTPVEGAHQVTLMLGCVGRHDTFDMVRADAETRVRLTFTPSGIEWLSQQNFIEQF